MKFKESQVAGAFIVDIEPLGDDRGFFSRAWCAREFQQHNLSVELVQANISYNRHKGTLRGLHYQSAPHEESKLVRCTRGSIYDVVVDLRQYSPSYLKWVGVELCAENRRMLYVPQGCAHGFITLEDDTEVFYQVSAFYTPEAEDGARYDDPSFDIEWPVPVSVISEKDANWPTYKS